jgi:hypothetical protein
MYEPVVVLLSAPVIRMSADVHVCQVYREERTQNNTVLEVDRHAD